MLCQCGDRQGPALKVASGQPTNKLEADVHRPLVSVIMNGFNSARYLAEAIASVLGQTYDRWEIIFWDNCSEDATEAIVRSFADPRIHFFRAPRQMPLAEGRNFAIARAGGSWVAFLDCDDLWLPDKLSRQVALLQTESLDELGLIYGRTQSFSDRGDQGETIYRYEGRPLPTGNILRPLLLEGNLVPIVSAMISKAAYDTVGGIPDHLVFAEDYWLFVAIASRYRAACVQDVCCRYRVHAASATFRNKLASHSEALDVLRYWGGALAPIELRKRASVYHTLIGIEKVRCGQGMDGIADILMRGSLLFLLRGALSTGFRTFVRQRRPFA